MEANWEIPALHVVDCKYVLLAGDDPKSDVVGYHAEAILPLIWGIAFTKAVFPYIPSFTEAERSSQQWCGGV